MTYTTARAQLVTLLEAATPTTTPLGLPSTFQHFPEADAEHLPPFRGFFIREGEDGDAGIYGPFIPNISGQPLVQTPVTLSFSYPLDAMDAQALDQVIAEDRKVLQVELLTETNWDSTTSKIQWLSENPLYAPARRERAEGATLLVFRFNLVHR